MDLRKTNLTIEFFSKYLNILNNFQKGTPWERAFSLHSATTDTAHVPWFYHCFATIDNFCLGFLQWLNKTKIQKNKKTRNQKTTKTSNQKNKKSKMARQTLCRYSPPWGVQSRCFFFVFLVSCFFWFSWFFGFLFSGSLLVFWRAKDLDLTLCQFSHFRGCKLAFGWFYDLLTWPVVPVKNHVKNYGKMQVSEEAWGSWDTN